MHHAVIDIYLDKNYGGILILWDRLFATFIEERDGETIVYGTRSPLRSWNPLWANLEVYKSISLDAWRARSFGDKLRIWIARPGWRPADVAAAWPGTPFDLQRALYHPPLSRRALFYCMAQFTILLLITTHFLAAHQSMLLLHKVGYGVWLGAGLWIVGGLMEMRPHYVFLEVLRLIATTIGVVASGFWFGGVGLSTLVQMGIVASAFASLGALWIIFKQPIAAPVHLSSQ